MRYILAANCHSNTKHPSCLGFESLNACSPYFSQNQNHRQEVSLRVRYKNHCFDSDVPFNYWQAVERHKAQHI